MYPSPVQDLWFQTKADREAIEYLVRLLKKCPIINAFQKSQQEKDAQHPTRLSSVSPPNSKMLMKDFFKLKTLIDTLMF